MRLNKLLQRQVDKFIPDGMQGQDWLDKFLAAVNNSYNAYERDQELADRAFKLSEEEYISVNQLLKDEVELKRKSIETLWETMAGMGSEMNQQGGDLLDIVHSFNAEIAKRRVAEADLQATANRLSALVANLRTGILMEDTNREIVLVNQFLCDLLGIKATPEDLQGRNYHTSINHVKYLFKDPDRFVRSAIDLTDKKTLATNEELELLDGRILERDYIPLQTGDQCPGHLWKYRDITARKKAEAALKASQELWQFALEGAGDGVWEYNFNTKEVYFSRQYKKMLGYEEDEFNNDSEEWMSRVHPDDIHLIREAEDDYFNNRVSSHRREYRIRHRNGTYLWILDRGMVINYTADGRPNRIVGTHTDITPRKHIEQELERLSQVASANENAVLFTDAAGKITWINDGFMRMTGYNIEEARGRTPIELFKGELTEKNTLKHIAAAVQAGENFNVEVVYYCKNGTHFWGRTKGQCIRGTDGNVMQFFGLIEDISLEKERENQIERLSFVASSNSAGVVIFDRNEHVEWFNPSFEYMTGFTLADLKGQQIMPWVFGPLTDSQVLARMMEKAAQKKDFVEEFIHYRKDRQTFWARVKMQFVLSEEGNVLQQFAIVEDISAEKEAKRKLAEIESGFRMAIAKIGDNVWEQDFSEGEIYFPDKNNVGDQRSDDTVDMIKNWSSMVYPGDRHLLIENEERYRAGLADHHYLEYRIRAKDGSIRWILDRGVVIEKNAFGFPLKVVGTHTDITERKLSEQLLRINEEKYRTIIANMNLGLLEVDTNEIIQYANQSFCAMSGFDQDEIIGKKASILFAKGENMELIESKNELRRTGLSDAYQIAVKNKRGELRWWLISGAPRYNDQGELVGSIGIHLDITDQKALEKELYEAREAAELSSSVKELFLANMSHEIRTPMNAIIGMGRQLSRTALDEVQLSYLSAINTSAEHLLVVINDILDISKIEAGKLELEQIGFYMEDVISHCLAVTRQKAEEKGLKLTSEMTGKQGQVLIGDPYRLEQVLINLLSNAVKFTERGGVTISAILKPVSGKVNAVIHVVDTGIGMDESFVGDIFKSFSQEDRSIARKYGGSGLGMSICKRLLELMNGKIEVKSRKSVGSTFTISIPFFIGKEDQIPQKINSQPSTLSLAGINLLLVEDNEMNRLVATTLLRGYGADITEAEDGGQAVAILKDHHFDAILMDMQMPVMDGLEATRVIQELYGKETPIIALTANAIKGESDRCREAGMVDYISKPFNEEELIGKLIYWTSKVSVTNEFETAPDKTGRTYDLSKLKKIGQGDEGFIMKMVGLFADTIPAAIEAMAAGLESGDFDSMRSVAHKIKPALDNMGVDQLYHTIRSIESAVPDGNEKLIRENISTCRRVVANVLEDLRADGFQIDGRAMK